jgi:putative FmdB family regulatory protein
MPLYEYKCRECGHKLEVRQGFAEDPLTHCPNCDAEQGLFRVVQPAGVVFKGSGFYITDSKGSQNLSKPGKRSSSESSDSSNTNTTTASTSDATSTSSSSSSSSDS